MRVIAGKYRHRNIKIVGNDTTRETQDRVKEGMFNSLLSLNKKFNNVIDLFSGSGSLGIEAISRFNSFVIFNDLNNCAYNVIKDNLNSLKIDNKQYKVYNMDYKFLLEKLEQKFDLLILDPPYNMINTKEILDDIYNKDILKSGSIVVFEMDSLSDGKMNNDFYTFIKEKKYGSKKVLFYKVN